MKPTQTDLLERTILGGRVFLFEYPENDPNDIGKGSHMPNYKAQEKIEAALLDLPGCKEVEGPYINGIIAITIDDTEDGAGKLTDDQWRKKIVGVFLRYWRE